MPLTVLVVDDIESSCRAQCALVTELGHVAIGADSGATALASLERTRPDLVLLDLLMPDMDGFEVTRRMRATTADRWLPVIVTSSLQGEAHFIRALENGADDYLGRPVSAGLLDAKLRHYARVLELQRHIATLAQRQQAILDNILDPVVTLDADGRVLEFNQAASQLAMADGAPLAEGLPGQALLGLPADALPQRHECRLHRRDGSTFPAEVSASEWHDAERRHLTLVLRDLSERRQVERMKDEFLATVSHELRTPLTSVLGAMSLLAGGAVGALPERAAPLLQIARRNGERLGRLVDDVLDLTKLEGDRLVLHLRPQDPWPLLQEAVAANQGYAEREGVRLALEPWAGAAGRPPPAVRLDADRFLQVMANLLSNAIKHSPDGETVRVSMRAQGSGVRITVRDLGPGFDPAFRERVFQKFAQADATDRRAQGGTGLGLYITRMLVERMAGQVQVDDGVATGASLSVTFCAADALTDTRPLLLHIDADATSRARLARWLEPVARIDGAARIERLDAAAVAAAQAVIGNPQDQGAADTFCDALQRLAAGRPVLVHGDSVDRAFCDRLQLPWISAAHGDAENVTAWVRRALARRSAPQGERA
jgi:signal transduction histidine kinase